MKKTTTNKLNMYQSVFTVMNDHHDAWQGVSAFVSAAGNFTSKLDLLRIRLVQQSSATNGVRAEKQFKVAELRERILMVQHALGLYGEETGNWALAERNSKTKTALDKLNIGKLALRCGELRADLDAFGAELTPYGITSAMIDELTPLIEHIDEINISTRQAIIHRKSVTQSIYDLEHALDALLRMKMDKLLLVFKVSQPAFFENFRNARMVIDYGHHTPGAPEERDDGGQEV